MRTGSQHDGAQVAPHPQGRTSAAAVCRTKARTRNKMAPFSVGGNGFSVKDGQGSHRSGNLTTAPAAGLPDVGMTGSEDH